MASWESAGAVGGLPGGAYYPHYPQVAGRVPGSAPAGVWGGWVAGWTGLADGGSGCWRAGGPVCLAVREENPAVGIGRAASRMSAPWARLVRLGGYRAGVITCRWPGWMARESLRGAHSSSLSAWAEGGASSSAGRVPGPVSAEVGGRVWSRGGRVRRMEVGLPAGGSAESVGSSGKKIRRLGLGGRISG